MPRSISVMRKYLAALSSELSLPSSHRSFRGSRNPCGGGPAGVAEWQGDVEKVAAVVVVAEGENMRVEEMALMGREHGRARVSTVKARAEAIIKWRIGGVKVFACDDDDDAARRLRSSEIINPGR